VRQALDGLLAEKRAVGEHGRRPDRQGLFQDIEHARVHEGFAAGEVVFLHPQGLGICQCGQNFVVIEESKRVIAGGAGDEAMGAGQVAEGAGELEPEMVKCFQVHPRREVLGGGDLNQRQGIGKRVGHVVVERVLTPNSQVAK
jgi:hypothetical protein